MNVRELAARRRGLAPLELVLAIPLLLFVVALSVIFGAVACWKVRGEVVARDAILEQPLAAAMAAMMPRRRNGAAAGDATAISGGRR